MDPDAPIPDTDPLRMLELTQPEKYARLRADAEAKVDRLSAEGQAARESFAIHQIQQGMQEATDRLRGRQARLAGNPYGNQYARHQGRARRRSLIDPLASLRNGWDAFLNSKES